MSWRRSAFALLALAGLAACGFHPLYGSVAIATAPADSPLAAGIKVDAVTTPTVNGGRLTQLLKADLEDQFNPTGAPLAHPAYHMSVSLVLTYTPVVVATDGTISRYNVYLDSKYLLYRYEDGKLAAQGSLRYVGSYDSVPNGYFSTYVAQGDSTSRGLQELSELYRERLSGPILTIP